MKDPGWRMTKGGTWILEIPDSSLDVRIYAEGSSGGDDPGPTPRLEWVVTSDCDEVLSSGYLPEDSTLEDVKHQAVIGFLQYLEEKAKQHDRDRQWLIARC